MGRGHGTRVLCVAARDSIAMHTGAQRLARFLLFHRKARLGNVG